MARLIRLHLGAGHYHWPGFVNLDKETDLRNLPYEDVDEIHCIHLFEHLPRWEIQKYLREWHSTLKEGGLLVMEMPSLDKIAQLILDGETNVRLTVFGIFGDPRDWQEDYPTSPARKKNPLMRHEWAWTNVELEEVLTKAGFEVEFAQPVFHIKIRDLRVIARKV